MSYLNEIFVLNLDFSLSRRHDSMELINLHQLIERE